MEFFAIPDEYVKKVAFIADVFERDNGYRPSDIQFICCSIDLMFNGVAESIGFGVCEEDGDYQI